MSEPNTTERLAEALCRLLPQTQCRQCGFDGCAQYARAIAEDRAEINRCAPGGKKASKSLPHLQDIQLSRLIRNMDGNCPLPWPALIPNVALDAASATAPALLGPFQDCPSIFLPSSNPLARAAVCACARALSTRLNVWTTEDAARAKADYERTNARRKASAEQRRAQLEKATDNKSAVLMQALLKAKSLKKS